MSRVSGVSHRRETAAGFHPTGRGWRSGYVDWNRVILAAAVAVQSVSCAQEQNSENIATSRAAVTSPCSNGPALGFENTSSWTTSSGTISQSSTHTQGNFSLAVNHPINYTTITSKQLNSSDSTLSGIDVGTSFEVDVLLPRTQPNPYWYGDIQMFVSCPTRGVYNQYLGQVELTELTLGVFLSKSFAIPDSVASALHNQTYSDLTLVVVLNVPYTGTGTYLLDNLRIKGTDGNSVNVHPDITCVKNKGAGKYEALFGYNNENGDTTNVPVGTHNQISPGSQGQGQLEDFLPISKPGAFSVLFNGNPITWSLTGGCAIASAQSQPCPNTSCNPACRYGQQCVGGKCVTECGDGLCAGDESCNTCPADCACAAGRVCVRNMCARPVQCGVDWRCGSGTSFGVNVDCGSCANGHACVNHTCQ